MNNSKLIIDQVSLSLEDKTDRKPQLREREGELVIIIDCLQKVAGSKEWSTLKEKVFDNLVSTLENQLKYEGLKEDPDTNKLGRIAGQMVWAKKYADLTQLAEIFRLELTQIRKQLYGSTSKES